MAYGRTGITLIGNTKVNQSWYKITQGKEWNKESIEKDRKKGKRMYREG